MAMKRDEFRQAIAKRNGWTDETRIECSGKGLRKLVEQAFDMGVKSNEDTPKGPGYSSVFDEIFEGKYRK